MVDPRYVARRIIHHLRGRTMHLKPAGSPRGNVLISYMTLPYLDRRQIVLDAHTNRWECMQIVRTFLDKQYAVDLIDLSDSNFVPKKQYVYFLDVGTNMERIAPLLNRDCVKIFLATTGYWRFFVGAQEKRLDAIEKRRGVRLADQSHLRPPPARDAIRICDAAIMLGNDATASTYPADVQQKIRRIPLSTTHMYPSPETKDFETARRNFLWFGGAGLAHKGLDLVLEAFSAMPEYSLSVVGKVSPHDPFAKLYKRELYETKNIQTFGWLDPGSEQFKKICAKTLGLVYPSCSEGCAGSVVLSMHAGIIPIVSRESGVDVGSFGITLKENTIGAIKDAVHSLANLPAEMLATRAVATWQYARARHTRERFAEAFADVIDTLEKSRK